MDLVKPSRWVFWAHVLLAVAAVLVFYVPYLFFPSVYVGGIAEDNWGEQATAVFAITGAALAWCARRPGWHWDQLGLYLFIGALFFFGMEEISWGQRIIGFSTPHWFQTSNIQNETTFHNFTRLNWLHRYLGFALLGWAFVSVWCVPRVVVLSRVLAQWGIPLARPHTVPVVVVASYFLFNKPLPFSDEAAECLFAFSMCVFAATLFAESPRIAPRARLTVLLLLPIWVLGSVASLMHSAPDDGGYIWRSLRLAQKMEARGLCRQAASLYEHYLAQGYPERSDMLVDYYHLRVKMGEQERAAAALAAYLPTLLASSTAQDAWTAGVLAQQLPLPEPALVYFSRAEQRAKTALATQPNQARLLWLHVFAVAAQGREAEAQSMIETALATATNAQQRDDWGVVRDQLTEWLAHEPVKERRAKGWWDTYSFHPKGHCTPDG